jgi:hypothetical protein
VTRNVAKVHEPALTTANVMLLANRKADAVEVLERRRD